MIKRILLCAFIFLNIFSMEEKETKVKVPLWKLPIVGKDAFFIGNPKNTEQVILLVPSLHCLNLRFVNPMLVKAIKALIFL